MPTLKAVFKLYDEYSDTMDKICKKTDKAVDKILKASGATDNFNCELAASGDSWDTANKGLSNFFGNISKARDTADDFNKKLEATGTSSGKAAEGLDSVFSKVSSSGGSMDTINNELDASGESSDKASKGIGSFFKSFVNVDNIKKAMDMTDEFINTSSKLSLINDGLQTQDELQNNIFSSANRSKVAYMDMADAVSQMGMTAGDKFKSNDEMIAFTELAQKSTKMGPASEDDQKSTLLSMSQAMGSGSLDSGGFETIMENAPMVADAIGKYTGKSKDQLIEMAGEGKITADIIKNSMFASSDEINAKFSEMPTTFADIKNRIQNSITQVLGGAAQKISKLLSSDSFSTVLDSVINGLAIVGGVIATVIGIASNLVGLFTDSWSLIEPIIWGIVAALVVYNATSGISWLTTLKDIGAKVYHTVVSGLETGAIIAMTLAQEGFNAALALCPISWIIIAIIALIVIIYVVVAAINKFTGASLSATGIIMGAFAVAGAFIYNLVIGVINSIIQFLWTIFVEPFLGIIEWVLNIAMGGFDSFGGAVANLIGNIISWFLSLGKVVTKIIDAIFGTNWTGGLTGLQNKVTSWGKNDKAITLDKNPPTIDRIKYGDAWNSGYKFGEGIDSKVKGFADKFKGDGFSDLLGDSDPKDKLGLHDDVNSMDDPFDPKNLPLDPRNLPSDPNKLGTPGNPASVKGVGNDGNVKVEISDQDLQYLRDVAERDYINKFTTATLAPNVQFTFGDIHEDADAYKIAGRIKKILREEIATASEGVY